jgi:enamine deaminase RidA (YjgF/YER057c/UK114 family)
MSDLSDPPTFPDAIRVGETIYIGMTTDPAAGIEAQTARSFEKLVARIEAAGAQMADLVNLRTYYVYAGGKGRDVTDYWERMTAVRLRYIADPGPAATALRVSGAPRSHFLIGADGVASLSADRQRIMPVRSWDWSIPVPLSQGWRVGDTVYVGGQISADRRGRSMAINDALAQSRNALEYIHHVLQDAGHTWSDVVSMRVCFKHTGDAVAAEQLLATIMAMLRAIIPEPRPTITALGVNLLYEGLVLEIDAIARRADKRGVPDARASGRITFTGFPAACITGDELHIGGLAGEPGTSLVQQIDTTLQRLAAIVEGSGFDLAELVRLTLFTVDGGEPQTAAQIAEIRQLVEHHLPPPRPVVTMLSLPGLPFRGQRFQLDGLAVRSTDRHVFFIDNG